MRLIYPAIFTPCETLSGYTVVVPDLLGYKLIREQRSFSRKEKGSNNRNKQHVKVALVHEKITNQQNDFLKK